MNENNYLNENTTPSAKKKVSFVHVTSANQNAEKQTSAPSAPSQPTVQANQAQPGFTAPVPAPGSVPQQTSAEQYQPNPYVSNQNYSNPYSGQYNNYNPYGQYNPYAGNPYYYGQYPYYNAQYSAEQYAKQLKTEQAKKKVRFLGNMAGISILLFLFVNILVSCVMIVPQFKTLYDTNAAFQSAFSIIASFLYIFIPFIITFAVMRKREPDVEFFPFAKIKAKRAILCIPIGLAVCIAGNVITNLLINLLSSTGVKLSQPSDSMAKVDTIPALLLSLVATAIMPALLEEFALRGVIMQPMRKYGMAFAIICSSVVFGVMHGNLIQAPFAFIVGLGLAFFAIKCGSLWIGVIIHMLNNGFSVVMSYLENIASEKTTDTITYIVAGVILVWAIISAIIIFIKDKDLFKKETGNIATEDAKLLTAGQKAFAFFVNVPMIVSLVFIAILTAQYVK